MERPSLTVLRPDNENIAVFNRRVAAVKAHRVAHPGLWTLEKDLLNFGLHHLYRLDIDQISYERIRAVGQHLHDKPRTPIFIYFNHTFFGDIPISEIVKLLILEAAQIDNIYSETPAAAHHSDPVQNLAGATAYEALGQYFGNNIVTLITKPDRLGINWREAKDFNEASLDWIVEDAGEMLDSGERVCIIYSPEGTRSEGALRRGGKGVLKLMELEPLCVPTGNDPRPYIEIGRFAIGQPGKGLHLFSKVHVRIGEPFYGGADTTLDEIMLGLRDAPLPLERHGFYAGRGLRSS